MEASSEEVVLDRGDLAGAELAFTINDYCGCNRAANDFVSRVRSL